MTVSAIIILLAIGYLVFTLDIKQKNIPVPVILVLIGTGLSFIPYFSSVDITEDIIYSIFLPGLLFVSAYQFSAKALRKHGSIIGFLSTFGIIITVILLGILTYYISFLFFGISLLGALLLASILTPTDPVSVVSVLKKSSDNPDIANIVDGESMINDGTSIVLFTVLFSMYTNNTSFQLLDFIQKFLFVSLGGIATGLVIGWLLHKIVHLFQDQHSQIMLSIVIAYGGFHLAEYFGFSGVLATVASGVMVSWQIERRKESDHFKKQLDGFWGVVEPSLLSLLFLLIGIEATSYLTHDHWIFVVIIFFVSLFVRFVVVSGTLKIFSRWDHITLDQSFLIAWSGIKGTMSFFLILTISLSTSEINEPIGQIAYSVVFISLIIQSIGVYPLSKLLNKK